MKTPIAVGLSKELDDVLYESEVQHDAFPPQPHDKAGVGAHSRRCCRPLSPATRSQARDSSVLNPSLSSPKSPVTLTPVPKHHHEGSLLVAMKAVKTTGHVHVLSEPPYRCWAWRYVEICPTPFSSHLLSPGPPFGSSKIWQQ